MWHTHEEKSDGRGIWSYNEWGVYPNAYVIKYRNDRDFVWYVSLNGTLDIGKGRTKSLADAQRRALLVLGDIL